MFGKINRLYVGNTIFHVLFLMIFFVLLLFSNNKSYAQSFETDIMTGGASGTYIQIGRDIADLAKQIDRNVVAVESAGSLENIEAVRTRQFTQFGIVQSDVLDFLRTFKASDASFRSILRNTRIVFPLYNEEIQIVTRKSLGITDIVGLSGRVVAVGTPDSGTNLTTTFLFEVANVRPEVSVPIGPVEAMEQLLAGKIDAFIYVAGAPTKLLADQNAEADLALVSVSNPAVADYYGFSTVKAGTYPWLTKDVVTPAVRAVLMTFDYDPQKNGYHRESCAAVADITYLIAHNIDYLRKNGHPKWNSVDFSAVPPGWERSQCVLDGMGEGYRPKTLPVMPAAASEVDSEGKCSELLNPIALQLCKMKANREN